MTHLWERVPLPQQEYAQQSQGGEAVKIKWAMIQQGFQERGNLFSNKLVKNCGFSILLLAKKGSLLKMDCQYDLQWENEVKEALLLFPLLPGQWPPVVHHLTLRQQRLGDWHRSVRDQGVRWKCTLVVDFHIDGSSTHLGESLITKVTFKVTLPTMRKQLIVLFHLGSLEPFWSRTMSSCNKEFLLASDRQECMNGVQKLPDTWASHTRCDPLSVWHRDPS